MKEHYNDDTDNPVNGGHMNVTIRPGTSTLAPLTIAAGTNLTTPASGSVEYDGSNFYLTTSNNIRRRIDNYGVTTQTGSYTLSATDSIVFANPTSGNMTLTLPTASSFTGFRFYIKRIDSTNYTVTVTRSGTDTIDGLTNFTLDLQYTALAVVSNGSNWYIL